MYHFTYQTKNLLNEKTYLGVHSTEDLNDGYLGSGLHLKRAIKKYGAENFRLIPLCFFDTSDEAYEEEVYLIDEDWIKSNDNYNIALGGKGGNIALGAKHSEESKKKRSFSMKGNKRGVGNKGCRNRVGSKNPAARKCIVDEIVYDTLTEVMENTKELNTVASVIRRIKSPNFKNWNYYD